MQPTSGMSNVHVRRKRQSMVVVVVVTADRADGYLQDGRKSSIDLRWRIMHRAPCIAQLSGSGIHGRARLSGEVCRLQQPVRRGAGAARTHECMRVVCVRVYLCVADHRLVRRLSAESGSVSAGLRDGVQVSSRQPISAQHHLPHGDERRRDSPPD